MSRKARKYFHRIATSIPSLACWFPRHLQYGAGRKLTVGDERIVDAIVKAEAADGYRFQDLIVAATTSAVFQTK